MDSDNTPFQRDFPEIWHDMPGQYIECTCKLTISINMMTNNIMIFNQLNKNATIYIYNILRLCSTGTHSPDWLTGRDHFQTTNMIISKQTRDPYGDHNPTNTWPVILTAIANRWIAGPWSLRRSLPDQYMACDPYGDHNPTNTWPNSTRWPYCHP